MKSESVKKHLSESEIRYRTLFDLAPVGISIVDANRNISDYNKALKKIARLTEKEIGAQEYKKRKYVDSSGNEIPDYMFPSSIALKNGRTIKDYEIGICGAGKNVFWTEVSAAPLDKRGDYAIVITKDINERKHLQNKLSESESRYRALYEHSMDAILVTVPDGRILFANPAACEMFKMTENEIITAGRNRLVDLSDERLQGLLAQRAQNGKVRGELRMIRKDGSVFPVEISSSVFTDDRSEKRTAMIIHDLTDTKDNIKRLQRSKTELKKINNRLHALSMHIESEREKERNRIARDLHDDLGQRLTALNLDIGWIRSRIGVQSQGVRSKMDKVSLDISEIIESIKEVSSGLRPSILYELGIVPAFNWQLEKFSNRSGIRYQFTSSPGILTIDEGLSIMLFRILQETLTNIIKHSGATMVKVRLQKIGGQIEMLVSDNGKGIVEKEIDSMKSMGLTGIKERVRSVSGRVMIKGEKKSGTTIIVTIPLKPFNDKNHNNR